MSQSSKHETEAETVLTPNNNNNFLSPRFDKKIEMYGDDVVELGDETTAMRELQYFNKSMLEEHQVNIIEFLGANG